DRGFAVDEHHYGVALADPLTRLEGMEFHLLAELLEPVTHGSLAAVSAANRHAGRVRQDPFDVVGEVFHDTRDVAAPESGVGALDDAQGIGHASLLLTDIGRSYARGAPAVQALSSSKVRCKARTA